MAKQITKSSVQTVRVFDFDGTLTDPAHQLGNAPSAFYKEVASSVCRPIEEIQLLASRFTDEVKENIGDYGIYSDGKIVCHAGDPLSTLAVVCLKMFQHYGYFMNKFDEQVVKRMLFQHNYHETRSVFRPYVRDLLFNMLETSACFYIVTNSDTSHVRTKMRELLVSDARLSKYSAVVGEKIVGGANKFYVDENFKDVPATIRMTGLARPIYACRPHYYNKLKQVLAETGADWPDLEVIGDLFELDLALPAVMGARFSLVHSYYTPLYEERAVARHPRGRVVRQMNEFLQK